MSTNESTRSTIVLNTICRWFVGLVFLFSSFVKGVDPMGTAFKIEEYFAAWSGSVLDFTWMAPAATFFAMLLITCEFLVGVLLVSNAFRRLSAWLLAAMMLFFTVSTALDAFSTTYGINDCGCFGDAVKLTPLQTFLKNIVLDIPTVILVLTRNKGRKNRFERDSIITLATIIAMACFGLYNINNEPCIDFRAWKVGNTMMNTDPELKSESFATYKNIATGQEREFNSQELTAAYTADSAFDDKWEWVSSRVIDPHEIHADGFAMMDADGNDHSIELISSPDELMIITIHHLDKVDTNGIAAMHAAIEYAQNNNIYPVMLTAALVEDADEFRAKNDFNDLETYFTDDKAIETMMRSNPGFVLMQDAIVQGKWHYNNVKQMISE